MPESRAIEARPTIITFNDIAVLDALWRRMEALPDILHLRAAVPGYEFTPEDKKLLLDTYSELDDILKEVAAFINIKFPGCERHVMAWNAIDFDTKIGPIKIITTDREHIKREWRKGLFDLKSLIKILRNETVLLAEGTENSVAKVKDTPERKNQKRPWLEILSWIAGILGSLISLYALLT